MAGSFKRLKLYWCETPDHDEDWFIIAYSNEQARRSHEDEGGYDRDYATAEFVISVPEEFRAHPGWATNEQLVALGAKVQPIQAGQRVMQLRGRLFIEARGQGRPNGSTHLEKV